MKKYWILLLAGAVMLALSMGCDNNQKDSEELKESQGDTESSFVEYSLQGTPSQWTNFEDGDEDGKLVVINSDAELNEYIDGETYPAIDFSKKTLLLAYGLTHRGIGVFSYDCIPSLTGGYKLKIEITLDDTTVVEDWVCSILVDKFLNPENNATLNVTIINNE